MARISPYEIFCCGWCVYYCKHCGFCHRPFDYKVREYGDMACEHFHPKPEKQGKVRKIILKRKQLESPEVKK